MLTHLLDTSVYSQRLKSQPLKSVVERWKKLGDQAAAISSVCEAELLYGLEKRGSERLWLEYRLYLCNRLVILPVDHSVAAVYGRLRHLMEDQGQPRSDFDLLIAATAVAHNLCLATLNWRHFEGIPDLRVENWGELRKLA